MLLGVFASWFWDGCLGVSVSNQLIFQYSLGNNFTVLLNEKVQQSEAEDVLQWTMKYEKLMVYGVPEVNYLVDFVDSSLTFHLSPGVYRTRKMKVPSGHPGQVDPPSGQVTFYSHLLDGQEIKQVVRQLNHLKSKGTYECYAS